MPDYRSKATITADQYVGEVIPDVICDGNRDKHGCDGSRAHMPHVHTRANGGITVVKPGDWIVAVRGGPFDVYPDGMFRSLYEVPEHEPPVAAPARKAVKAS